MAQRDLHNMVKSFVAIPTSTISTNTTTNGVAIDTQGYDSTEFFIIAGTLDATIVFTPSIQVADDAGFTVNVNTVVDPFLIGTTAITDPGSPPGPNPAFTNANAGYATTAIADATLSGVALDSNKVARIGVLNKQRYVRLVETSTDKTTSGIITALAVLSHPHMPSTPKDK
jgi:hypothetical protein